jgi:hypothetical protein
VSSSLVRRGRPPCCQLKSCELDRLNLDSADTRQWAARHASLDDPATVAYLLNALHQAGAHRQVKTLAARNLAGSVTLDDPATVAYLLNVLREAGASRQVTTLAVRAADGVRLDNLDTVECLLDFLRRAGTVRQFDALAAHIAASATSDCDTVPSACWATCERRARTSTTRHS